MTLPIILPYEIAHLGKILQAAGIPLSLSGLRCGQQVSQQQCVHVQMHVLRQLVGEVFDAAVFVASEKDADLRYNEVRGAFLPVKEDTWQEVRPMRPASLPCSHSAESDVYPRHNLRDAIR